MKKFLTLVLVMIGATFLGLAQRVDEEFFAEFMAEFILGELSK